MSADAGSATKIPAAGRPRLAVLDAIRASSSAVAAPADTASMAMDAGIPSASPRCHLVNDRDKDGQGGGWLLAGVVLISGGYLQVLHRRYP